MKNIRHLHLNPLFSRPVFYIRILVTFFTICTAKDVARVYIAIKIWLSSAQSGLSGNGYFVSKIHFTHETTMEIPLQ